MCKILRMYELEKRIITQMIVKHARMVSTLIPPPPPIASKSALKILGKGTSFADYRKSIIRGGFGGDGAISFRKAPSQTIGPPEGGNGGKGGSLYIVAQKNLTSLNDIKESYRVDHGRPGAGRVMHGSDGEDTTIYVPVGTIVRQIDKEAEPRWVAPESDDELYRNGDPRIIELLHNFKFRKGYVPQDDRIKMLMERIPFKSKHKLPLLEIDLITHGQRHLIFRGGRGGFGNPHFRSPLIPGPGICGRGERVDGLELEFELKTLADAGLVGLPNAGKSTLLKAVSNAHPQIAPYPFTTLNPYIGTIDFADHWTMSIADMPGILPGAHQDIGLGLRFLRHIERNKIFVYVIDLAAPEPWKDLSDLQAELEFYKPGLTNRPSIVAANKADVSSVAKKNLEILKTKTNLPIIPISAKLNKNVTKLTSIMRSLVEKVRDMEKEEAMKDL